MFKQFAYITTTLIFLMAACGGDTGGHEVLFENVSELEITNQLKKWLKKNNFKENQSIKVFKDPKHVLQLQLREADLDGTYKQILEKLRLLAGASEAQMRHQSDGFIEMSPEIARRLVKALFMKS
jgi:hypothetical protein